ncbi:MAG: AAA family ATPase [Nitrospira sp.]|nr:AAA family ATPase [Nitrospira sp.]MDH5724054.1 AAA family ATPase [Nitrospira sp.]
MGNLKHADHQRHLLITGLPGVGKTTLIRELAERLAEYRPAGFYTEEILNERGIREGFRLVTLCGRQLILSHIQHPGPYRVGRYGVDVVEFECLLEELDLRDSLAPLIIIDEIGRMECFSRRFVDVVTLLLDGPKTLVATIALKGEGFIRQVKQRPDCRLVTVTRENRDRLPDELASELQERLRK